MADEAVRLILSVKAAQPLLDQRLWAIIAAWARDEYPNMRGVEFRKGLLIDRRGWSDDIVSLLEPFGGLPMAALEAVSQG
jgi:hypothetical protein